MPLVLQWSNLGEVALPFLISACLSAVLTSLLWRVGEKGGLVHRRSACLGCAFEATLRRHGECSEACAVNWIPRLPLGIFFLSTTLLLLAIAFPWVVIQYVVPLGAGSVWGTTLLGLVAGSLGFASVLVAGYFVQERGRNRRLFLRVGAAGTIVGVAASFLLPSGLALTAALLTPLALWTLFLGLGLERYAQQGRPALGLKALGLAILPILLLSLVAMVRLLALLNGSGAL
jgi:hypothetical protein